MDENTLAALKASIKKWKLIAAGKERSLASRNCPLCAEFERYELVDLGDGEGREWRCTRGSDGEICPVQKATGKNGCGNTPYEKFEKLDDGQGWACTDEEKAAALEEVEFLESLLPKEEQNAE